MQYQHFSSLVRMIGQQLLQLKLSSSLVLLVCLLSIFPIASSAQNNNKVVVIPLGDSLNKSQTDVLDFFSYDAANDRLTIAGTAANPLSEVFFQNINVRGASQVRQDSRTNAPDIPVNQAWTEMEEENITLGAAPNNNQAVVVHAFATIDSVGTTACPCEFRGRIVQDNALASRVRSIPVHLEVEGGDGDVDATIIATFAFIATALTQNYSFEVQLFNHAGGPVLNDLYEVDEAGITISTFGLAGVGTLKLPAKSLSDADQGPE